jgi:putative ABC transport system ATP-binding protein
MQVLIKTVSLQKEFRHGGNRTLAVKDASLELNKGESIAITGPSGCGKTTLLNMLGLIMKPSSGGLFVQGADVKFFSEKKRAEYRNQFFGYIVQDFALIEEYSVSQNVGLPLLYGHRISRREHKIRVSQALSQVGILEKLQHKVKTLSGGQRQRVAIARALVNNPQVILADEPTGSLDSEMGDDVAKLLVQLVDGERSLILVTHNDDLAAQCMRQLTMKDGQIDS